MNNMAHCLYFPLIPEILFYIPIKNFYVFVSVGAEMLVIHSKIMHKLVEHPAQCINLKGKPAKKANS